MVSRSETASHAPFPTVFPSFFICLSSCDSRVVLDPGNCFLAVAHKPRKKPLSCRPWSHSFLWPSSGHQELSWVPLEVCNESSRTKLKIKRRAGDDAWTRSKVCVARSGTKTFKRRLNMRTFASAITSEGPTNLWKNLHKPVGLLHQQSGFAAMDTSWVGFKSMFQSTSWVAFHLGMFIWLRSAFFSLEINLKCVRGCIDILGCPAWKSPEAYQNLYV